MNHRPLLLVVLDGWGHREEREHNAIARNAHTFDELLGTYPHTLLSASGEEVGLPLGLMGNSEVGHMSLGAGRVVCQDITRIDQSVRDGTFFENGTLLATLGGVRRRRKNLHVVGLISDGGVHSSDFHLRNLLELAAKEGFATDRVLVHAILDGRDTPPRSGAGYLEALQRDIEHAGVGRIASIVGRYWAMDRDNRWDRVRRAYDLFTGGIGKQHPTAAAVIQASYAEETGDEFVEPSVVGNPELGRMVDGDGVFCINFRADRMRQLVRALGFEDFTEFERELTPKLEIATMTQYHAGFPFPVAYPPIELEGVFSEVISAAGLRQERIAETEKYAHVTFFFSGGREQEWPGESRRLIPSPRVATYDLQPEMGAPAVADAVLASLERGETDCYVVNFANADMVGHTGSIDAADKAVRAVDDCLKRIVPEVTRRGGLMAITADHGNAELMWDERNDQPHTAHTTNPVPIVFCANDVVGAKLRKMGTLADVAPTLLELCGIERPAAMDGRSLFL